MAPKAKSRAVGHSTKERIVAEYIREVRDYVEEHGRPPRNSSSLVGTAEYRLRNKVQYQVKKGRFSEEERRELAQLFEPSAPATGVAMAGNEYIQQVRDFVAEHGRPPRYSSRLEGTAEYQLRRKVQLQLKKGRFSEEERRELAQLFEHSAPAGGASMAGNGPPKAAAAGQVPAVSASQRNYSAAAASGWQAGVGTEVAAPATPRDRPTSTLLGSVGASASLSEALHPTYGPKAKSTKLLLVVKNPWLDLILAKKKTWEIRDAQTKQRGRIHLALSGAGGRIVGQCHITDSFAVDKSVLKRTYSKHRVNDLAVIRYRRPHAWVLTKPRRYEKPFVYSHPRGAIRWVKL